jgi:hypothetical protein
MLGRDGMGQLRRLSWFSSSRNLNITRARRIGGVSAQAGKAACAAATAASTSALLASATWPVTAPVAGLNTSARRPLWPGTTRPLIQCSMEATAAAGRDICRVRSWQVSLKNQWQGPQSMPRPRRPLERPDFLITLFNQ